MAAIPASATSSGLDAIGDGGDRGGWLPDWTLGEKFNWRLQLKSRRLTRAAYSSF
jgi:hypothetical protein